MAALAPVSRTPRIRVLAGGRLVIGLTVLLGIAAAHSGQNLLQVLVALLLSFQLISGFRSFLLLRRLEVEARADDRVDAGASGALEVVVTNRKRRLAALSLEVDALVEGGVEVAPAWIGRLAPGDSVRVTLPLRGRRRGLARIAQVRVASAYPCDLFRRSLRFPLGAEVLVRPARREARPPERSGVEARDTRVRLAARGGGEFRGVRPYREGDPPRAIHWRTSARVGALVVREDETRSLAPWTIVLAPLAQEGEALEEDLAVAAALCRAAAAAGREASLRIAGAPAPLVVRAGRRLGAALDALARFRATRAPVPAGPPGGRVFLVGHHARPPAGAASVERAPFAWVGPSDSTEALP